MRKSLFAGVMFVFAAPLGAQAASYTFFGAACNGSQPIKSSLYRIGLPRIGRSFTIKGGFMGWVPNSGSYQQLLITSLAD